MTQGNTTGPLLLGLDLGTSSIKALAATPAGRVVATGSAEYPIVHPQPGHAEQDPVAWWAATVAAVKQLAAAVDLTRVVAVGLSGQMHGTVLLDEAGALLGNAIIWPDPRSARQVEALTDQIGAARLIAYTGSPLATGFQAATVRWLQEEASERWARVGKILLPKDYLRWRLTNIFATDPSDGSGTLLLDVQTRDWSPELLAILGIDRTQLPPVQPSTSDSGPLTSMAAAELGLPAGIPVVIGGADTPCSALAAAAIGSDTLLLTLSTGGQMVLPITQPMVDPQGRIHTFCATLAPGGPAAGWYQMGAILAAGLALRWLRDAVFGLTDADAYTRMTAAAGTVPPGANGLLFLPYLSGERTPHMDPHARGAFLGLTSAHGQRDLTRAVMEGVAFACLDALNVLREMGAGPAEIVLAGGGARSPFWRQIIADAFGLPVRPLQVGEQSAVGACMLAGLGIDALDKATMVEQWVRYGAPTPPIAAIEGVYAEQYARFRAAYVNNRALFWIAITAA